MNGAEPGLELTPGQAAFSALGAGFAHLALTFALVAALGVSPAVVGLGAVIAYGTFFALLAPRLGESPAARLGFVRPARGSALAGALLLPAVLLISEIDNLVRTVTESPAAAEQAVAGLTLRDGFELALVGVVVFPLVYGVFFRGILQPALVERLGPLRGVLLCALLEASADLVHSPLDWPERAVLAALLGALRQASGSLLPALLLHAGVGALGTAAQFGVFGIAGFDDLSAPHTPLAWLAAASASTALGLWVCGKLSQTRTGEPS